MTEQPPQNAAHATNTNMARVALDALPKPIGYAVTMHPHLPTWIRGGDVYPTTADAETYADELRSLTYAAGITPTIVALVPVQTPQDAPCATNTTPPAPTAPQTLAGPQTATQGRDQWVDGYAAAKRFYGDTAPLVLGKIRDLIGPWAGTYGSSMPLPARHLIADLQAILDTATEPR